MMGTGGGPEPKKASLSSGEEGMNNDMQEILGEKIEGLPSEFDGDARVLALIDKNDGLLIIEKELEEEPALQGEFVEAVVVEEANTSLDLPSCSNESSNVVSLISNKENWAKYTPEMLRTKKSDILKSNNGRKSFVKSDGVKDRISQWAAAKASVEGSKEKYLKKEQDLRLQFLHERHQREIDILERKAAAEIESIKQKADLEMQLMQQEHQLKMEHLRKKQ